MDGTKSSVLKGRIGLQAFNSQRDACVHPAGSQGSASAFCTAAGSADVCSHLFLQLKKRLRILSNYLLLSAVLVGTVSLDMRHCHSRLMDNILMDFH